MKLYHLKYVVKMLYMLIPVLLKTWFQHAMRLVRAVLANLAIIVQAARLLDWGNLVNVWINVAKDTSSGEGSVKVSV